MTDRAKGCEGVAKGFAKGSAKALTCKSKGSKGFSYAHAHKEKDNQQASYATAAARNPFDPFAPQVNPFAHPFANPFATPSHPFDGPR
jgi:hypothetical protein